MCYSMMRTGSGSCKPAHVLGSKAHAMRNELHIAWEEPPFRGKGRLLSIIGLLTEVL